jgi:exodeoxyribonuclease-1
MPTLNEIGEPLMWYCQPANDYLPDPQSCLITGITPQLAWERGVPEREFAARIEAEMAQPGTIGVGYNTIRFDDEITRFMFWRNLIDPYAREWQNQCGRWDLLDVVRMAYALRPDGIWPTKDDGTHSFKLEHLSRPTACCTRPRTMRCRTCAPPSRWRGCCASSNPRLFDFAWACTRRTAWPPSCACPPRRRRRDPFCMCRACFRRTRLSGRDVAAGQPPHQQERNHCLGPGARPARTGHARRRAPCACACSRVRPTCPRASRACPSRPCT